MSHQELLEQLESLQPQSLLDRLMFQVDMPPEHRPQKNILHHERCLGFVEWTESNGRIEDLRRNLQNLRRFFLVGGIERDVLYSVPIAIGLLGIVALLWNLVGGAALFVGFLVVALTLMVTLMVFCFLVPLPQRISHIHYGIFQLLETDLAQVEEIRKLVDRDQENARQLAQGVVRGEYRLSRALFCDSSQLNTSSLARCNPL